MEIGGVNHNRSSMSAAKPTDEAAVPWHRDFAGNATDSVLLLFGMLAVFCVLSGKWWVAAYTFFFMALAAVVTLMAAHQDYQAQVILEERARAARRAPKARR